MHFVHFPGPAAMQIKQLVSQATQLPPEDK